MSFSPYKTLLLVHIIGITIMAGATFVDFGLLKRLLTYVRDDNHRANFLSAVFNGLQKFMGIGMLVILISGVGMMAYMHMVWGQQTWFRIKMVILLFIIINGLGFRRFLGAKLLKLIANGQARDLELIALERRMYIVQYFQMLLFVVIFCLSVFKFN